MFKSWGDSNPGRERENNEDRCHFDDGLGIFIVVDGVGGQAAGEKAAEKALTQLRARLERRDANVADRIREAITLANREILRVAATRDEWKGMACVLTVAVVEDGLTTIGHVGDTRLYKLRRGTIRKVTQDHSPVGEREDRGELTEIEAMRHPRRNEVYRDVGTEEHDVGDEDFIDIVEIPFEPDSAMLLCSDGLSDMITSDRILQLAQQNAPDPYAVVRALIDAANEAGGKDNITVVFVEGDQFAASSQNDTVDSGRLDHPAIKSPNVALEGRTSVRQWTPQGAAITVATSKPPVEQHSAASRSVFLSVLKLLRSRWAIFIYGALAGMIVLNFLQARFGANRLTNETRQVQNQSRTFTVGPSGKSDFATINDALDKARPGDVIEVAPGEYRERIELTEGVLLISQRPREAVIRLSDQAADPEIAIIADKIKGTRLVGFRVVGDQRKALAIGLRIVDSDIEIEDMEISGARIAGVEIGDAAVATLRANYIHDNGGSGVVVRGESTPLLTHNVIARNGTTGEEKKPGIEILERASPVLIRNVIIDNAAGGVWVVRPQGIDEILEKNFFGIDGRTNSQKVRVIRSAQE